jgi:PKD repeat protein
MGTAAGSINSFTVSVKNVAGCETIKSVNVASALKPAAAMSYTVVSGRTVQFKFAGSNAADVYWNYSDGNESFQQEPTYTFSADGTFKVMVVANNPPCKSDTVYFDVTVAASNSIKTVALNQFVLMPNPSQGSAIIRFAGEERQLAVTVVDATGKSVFAQTFQQVQGQKGVEMSLTHLTPGLYHVVIQSAKGETRSNLQIIR